MMADEIDNDTGGFGTLMLAVNPIVSKSAAKSDDDGRYFSAMLNANTVDWQAERYVPEGIDYKSFMACGGPIYGSHWNETTADGRSCVVANVRSMEARKDGLFIKKAEFDMADDLGRHYAGKVQRKVLRAMSARFLVREWDYEQKGGMEVRVVKKSILVHGILTAQPVNRQSLIGRKSLERIDQLARELESLKSESAPLSRFEELAESIKSLSDRLEAVLASRAEPAADPEAKARIDQLARRFTELAATARQAAGAT